MDFNLHRPTPSPVPHLFSSNDPPSQEDVKRIEEALSISRSDILYLQSAQNGESQQPHIEDLREFVRVHQSLSSVVRRIPPEIWALVFERSLADEYAIGPSDIQQVIKLTFVCHLWRSIALSNPSLWRNLPCFSLTKRVTQDQDYLRFVREIVERGREIPISFRARARFKTIQSHPLLDLLVSQSHRWRHVMLETTAMTLEALAVKGRIPMLHTLELNVTNMRALPRIINPFKDAPCLRIVKIKGLWPLKIDLPWHQLEEYTEDGAGPIGLPYILQQSVELRSLACLTYAFQETYIGLPRVIFAGLTSLQLHGYEQGDSYGPLLEHLTLPALTEVKVLYRAEELLDELIRLVQRSDCKLQKLTLSSIPPRLQMQKITELLLLAPLLEELDIGGMPTSGILERLMQPVVVPRLRSLILQLKPPRRLKTLLIDEKLNSLARFRCSRDRTSAAEGDCTRLDVLRLMFETSDDCLASRAALERWHNAPRSQSDWEVLSKCARELEEMVPPQRTDGISLRSNKILGLDIPQLQSILRKLEDLPNTDPRVMLHSNVIDDLRKLKQSPMFESIPETDQKYITEAEVALRQRWTTNAKKCGLVVNWIRSGQDALTYVPDASEAAIGVEEFLYGV